MNVKDIRRQNLRALARTTGGVSKLAKLLDKSQSQISHLIGTNPTKNLGDKVAHHIEQVFNKPLGWLDQMHLGEDEAVYHVTPAKYQSYYQVPVLTWKEAQNSLNDKKSVKKGQSNYLITHVALGPRAFALRIEGDSMESQGGPSFPRGSLIIFDPELSAHNGAFVLVREMSYGPLTFKQLVIDGARQYLKPLNPRYPLVEIGLEGIICGVLRFMMLEFK